MMTPLISIISGTFNRLAYLTEMIISARRLMPDGIDYNFIIVDGGSVDGTIEYCKKQPDVVLIEQGALVGAIKAFGAGFERADGEYLVVANDDISFVSGILDAVVYLETHPDCGAVAFADDRLAPGYEEPGFHVQTIRAIRDGEPVDVIYPQVGMVRAWLAKEAGYWGHLDPLMGEVGTYGGDSYLGGRIWELGYTVDAVDACKVQDRVAPDMLRERNHGIEQQIGSAYYRRFPNGVHINSQPKPANPQTERLRILLATLYEPGFGKYKHGLRDAFMRVGLTADIDYVADPNRLVGTAESWQPHIVFGQMRDANLMRYVRQACPSAVICSWDGDVWANDEIMREMLEQARWTNLNLFVNDDTVSRFRARGLKAAYWQVAPELVPPLPTEQAHDILFLANAYSDQRKALGERLREWGRGKGYNVGLYGKGWIAGNGDCLYDFARGAALYERCKLAIGDSQFADRGFVSNRLFEAIANGACLLHQTIPGLEELTGLQAGVHYYAWDTFDQLTVLIDYLMNDDGARAAVAEAGKQFVRTRHTFDNRVAELRELIGGLK